MARRKRIVRRLRSRRAAPRRTRRTRTRTRTRKVVRQPVPKRAASAKQAGKQGATALVSLIRITPGSTFPVMLNGESSCSIAISPGRPMRNVKIEVSVPPGIFLKSCDLRDGDRVSGPGVVGCGGMQRDGLNGFVLHDISPQNQPVLEFISFAALTADTPLDITVKEL